MILKQIDDIITGVWAIFLRKKNALTYFTVNIENFIWSFSVIILVLVFQLYLTPVEIKIFESASNGTAFEPIDTYFQAFILMINWFLWPVISYVICKLMGLTEHYIRYVIVDNFSSIVTLAIIAMPSILFQFGLSSEIARSLIFFTSFIMLMYKWRVIKVALATSGLNASILLFIDLAATIIVASSLKTIFI